VQARLAVARGVLGPPAPRDVLDDGDEVLGGPVRVAHQGHSQVDPEDRAILVEIALLQRVARDLAVQHLAHAREIGVEVVGMGDVLEGLGEQLFARVAELFAEPRVDPQPAPVEADMRDADRGLFKGRPEPRLALAQLGGRARLLARCAAEAVRNFVDLAYPAAQRRDIRGELTKG
jgi:hypothetical protein